MFNKISISRIFFALFVVIFLLTGKMFSAVAAMPNLSANKVLVGGAIATWPSGLPELEKRPVVVFLPGWDGNANVIASISAQNTNLVNAGYVTLAIGFDDLGAPGTPEDWTSNIDLKTAEGLNSLCADASTHANCDAIILDGSSYGGSQNYWVIKYLRENGYAGGAGSTGKVLGFVSEDTGYSTQNGDTSILADTASYAVAMIENLGDAEFPVDSCDWGNCGARTLSNAHLASGATNVFSICPPGGSHGLSDFANWDAWVLSAIKTMIHVTYGIPTFTGYTAPALAVSNACANAVVPPVLPGLSVLGTDIVANGVPIRLRGVDMGDPFWARNPAWYPYTTADYATLAQDWHANVVRISIFPTQWKNTDGTTPPATLLAGLDTEIQAALNNGMYVIISYHVIGWPDGWYKPPPVAGNPADEYDSSMIVANSFWDQMALTYGKNKRIIFDLWNEPAHDAGDWAGGVDPNPLWPELKGFYTTLIQHVRDNRGENIVLVSGNRWSSWLVGIKDNPIADPNVVYAYHKYAIDGLNTEAEWDKDTGGLIGVKPVIVSEWGFEDVDVLPPGAPTDGRWPGSQASYGDPFTQWMDKHNLSNLAWMYHHDWTPALLKADGSLTIYGAFVKNYMTNAAPPVPGGCGALVVDSGVANAGKSINGFLNDQYKWYDSACRLRSTALARNDAAKGGNAKQFTYMLADGTTTRTVNPSSDGASGFGYVVAHLSNPSFAWAYGADDSPLGSGNSATYDKLFSGDNHAIHEYTLNYVRYGLTQAAIASGFEPWTWINDAADPNRQNVTAYNVPVRIQWMFATGRDYPVWSVTFDLSAAPDHAIDSDFRAPYGDMNIEGGSGADLVSGVAWGDKYKFVTSGSPFTMDNDWDYSQLNTGAPYDSLWTSTVDAEMGLAGTRITALQNAGGYSPWPAVWRGKTSLNMNYLCPPDTNGDTRNSDGYTHKLPCASDWAYQLIQYSVASANATTSDKRLAWGADWGSLGNSSFDSSNGYAVSGYPKVSYSVYVVLDPHSKNPTQNIATQAETVSLTALTAAVGTVRTQGSAGVGRADNEAYNPVGYSPIFGTWEVDALNNNVNLSFAVSNLAPSTLDTPIIVIHNYTELVSSAQILLDGVALTANSDYFISVRPAESELWITLNKKLAGVHNFQVVTTPAVLSITRANPSPTKEQSVDFTVTFSKPVINVDALDFDLTGIADASITNVVDLGSGNAYTVSVDTGSGDGTIRLDVGANDIADADGNLLDGVYTSGQIYTIDKTAPTILSITRAEPNSTAAINVDFTITFDEPVTGVSAGDFSLDITGVTGAAISSVGGGGATRKVTVNTGTGSGAIRLDVPVGATITDLVGNPLVVIAPFTGGETYTVKKSAAYYSTAANDGWVLQSKQGSSFAGTKSNIGTLRVGDDARNRQYRSLLYFNTSSLPDNAKITKATLKIKKAGTIFGNPFANHGALIADMAKGFFGLSPLELGDFQAASAPIRNAGNFKVTVAPEYQLILSSINLIYINPIGVTQFRLRFEKENDNDKFADFISFYSGDITTPPADRPQLFVEYTIP